MRAREERCAGEFQAVLFLTYNGCLGNYLGLRRPSYVGTTGTHSGPLGTTRPTCSTCKYPRIPGRVLHVLHVLVRREQRSYIHVRYVCRPT